MKRSRLIAAVPLVVASLFVGGTAFASPSHHGHDATRSVDTRSADRHSKDRRSSSPDSSTSPDSRQSAGTTHR